MFEFDPEDYRHIPYGVVSKKFLAGKKQHVFTLWDEELILFWNDGNVRCYKNACKHYGLSLSKGRLRNGSLQCSFHGWEYNLDDGRLITAPYAKKIPKCRLDGYKAFVKGGIVFVYQGEEENFEGAQKYILDDVLENPASTWTVYETPFFLAINSSTDYPHHAFHTLFYTLYGFYRKALGKKNPLMTTYTSTMIEETENFFKFKIAENEVEVTVYPFCSQYNDLVAGNKWQMFVSPISKTKSRYLINIKTISRNPLYQALTYLFFYTVIRHLAMPEDQAWLKDCFQNLQNGASPNLCDHDFGLRNYLRKFFIPASKSDRPPI